VIRALVVDDEELARERIVTLLGSRSDVEVVGESRDGLEAVRDIARLEPDLVFLDVQMPGLDGFEVIEALEPDLLPVVVFVTAYDEHALRAFEVHAIDYLLKPIDPQRFAEALARADALVRAGGRNRLPDPRELGERPRRFVGRRGAGHVVVPHEEVVRIEAAGNYVRVHSTEGECLVRSTMKGVEDRLDPARFQRIHRSTIVHLAHVRSVEPLGHGEYEVMTSDGGRLKCSRAHGAALRRALES